MLDERVHGRMSNARKPVHAEAKIEKNWLLLYNRNLLVVPLRIEGADVTAIEQHLSIARLVKLLNQRDN